jgi:hypothetical protein
MRAVRYVCRAHAIPSTAPHLNIVHISRDAHTRPSRLQTHTRFWSRYEIADELLVGLEVSPLSQHFMEVPDRKADPVFYRETPNALTVKKIRGKILWKNYQTLHEFVLDIESMFADARRRVVKTDAAVYANSIALQELFVDNLQVCAKASWRRANMSERGMGRAAGFGGGRGGSSW